MDRNMIMAIMGALPDDKLMKALSVAGLKMAAPGGDLAGLAVDDPNNRIESWNERSIAYDGGGDRPALADKQWAKPSELQPQAPVQMGGQMDDGIGETNVFLQTGGGA